MSWKQNTHLIHFRVRGGWSLSQLPSGERQGSPETGFQFITGPTQRQATMHTHTLS